MSKAEKKLEALLGEMRKANEILEGSSNDGGRRAAAIDGQKAIAADLSANDETRELDKTKTGRKSIDEQLDELRELMGKNRRGSKAKAIGSMQPSFKGSDEGVFKRTPVKLSGALKAMLSDPKSYRAGYLLDGILDANGIGMDGKYDPSLIAQGKAHLSEMMRYGTDPGRQRKAALQSALSWSLRSEGLDPDALKATLGTTGATGGYVLPNNLVDSVVKPATAKAVYQNLITTINGVAVRGVDQPYRTNAAQRATFVDWGTTKTNVNEAYGTYSANLGTIAIIYDIGKQYARFSAGSAEQDVMDEITRGMILGENYYIAVGAGSGGVGTGDPTTGIYTALNASSSFNGYTTSFSGASNSTVVGSFAAALTQAGQSLATRSREATAWVTDAVTFWTTIGQAAGTFGFILTPAEGPSGFSRTASGGLTFWNQPVYYDPNLNSNSGTTKIAIGGEWDTLKLYRGMEFRIDTTDVAGTRWDQNLIGFRGEEEIAINANTAVNIGAFQLITSVIP